MFDIWEYLGCSKSDLHWVPGFHAPWSPGRAWWCYQCLSATERRLNEGKEPGKACVSWEMVYKCCINSVLMYLVGGIPTPLKNMTSSVGMKLFPIYGKIFLLKTNPNHQSGMIDYDCIDVDLQEHMFSPGQKWTSRTPVESSGKIWPSAGPISMVWPSICLGWFCWKTHVVSVQDFRVGYQKSLDLNIYIIIYISGGFLK